MDPSCCPEMRSRGEGRDDAGTIVVAHRQRLFRDGISELLAASGQVEVVATASNDTELLAACREHHPRVALVQVDVLWDTLRLVAVLRQVQPCLTLIGMARAAGTPRELARARQAGMVDLIPAHAGIAGILEVVCAPRAPSGRARRPGVRRPTSVERPPTLTGRELEILSLVGAGLTSTGVSNRLNISRKTVENHKQRIFAKLGVQNQAHAVSIAIRTGVIPLERIMDLAVGD